jgi:MYXO-CTERM domain-containing protein
VINEALLDWQNRAQNYLQVLTLATNEATDGQSFVTEYAATSSVMRDILDPAGRFGNTDALAAMTQASDFAAYLAEQGYFTLPVASSRFGGGGGPPGFSPQAFDSVLRGILQRSVVMPPRLAMMGVEPSDFYGRLHYYLGQYRQSQPELFMGWEDRIDGAAAAREIDEKIVQPTRAAGQLFRAHQYLTRLFTFLDPDQMTVDPTFDFNPSLPEQSNLHVATMTISCPTPAGGAGGGGAGSGGGFTGPNGRPAARILRLPSGRRLFFAPDEPSNVWTSIAMPKSLRIEHLPLEGAPAVELDNTDRIDVTIATRNEEIARRYSQWDWGSPMAGPPLPQPQPDDPVNPAPMDPVTPKAPKGDSGCSSAAGSTLAPPALLLFAVAALGLRRRRRSAM